MSVKAKIKKLYKHDKKVSKRKKKEVIHTPITKLISDIIIKKDPVLELLREAESKSFSLEDTQKFVKETKEQLSQLKNTGPDLIQ